MPEIELSIIIPTLNRRELLRAAVESCAGIRTAGLEILIADNGSEDGTQDWARELGPPVRLVPRPAETSGGPSAARNRGLRASSGRFVVFLDSDDVLVASGVDRCLEQMRAAEHDLVFGHYQFFGNLQDPRCRRPDWYCVDSVSELPWALVESYRWIPLCSAVYRREFIDAVPFEERWSLFEDTRFQLDCLLGGARVARVPDLAARYRLHAGQETLAGLARAGQARVGLLHYVEQKLSSERQQERWRQALASGYWLASRDFARTGDWDRVAEMWAAVRSYQPGFRIPSWAGWKYRFMAKLLGGMRAERWIARMRAVG